MAQYPALAAELRTAIERWTAGLRRHRLLALARSGELGPRALGLYLVSLQELFRQSHMSLLLAAYLAARRADAELAAHFARRADDEHGHDGWAASDLSWLPRAALDGLAPALAIRRLIELQRSLVARQPVCLIVYGLWAEYFTALLGDEWLDALASSGFQRAQLSAVARHLDADREHAADGFAEIDRFWRGDPSREELIGIVGQAGGLFESFCDEICRESISVAQSRSTPLIRE